MRVENDVLALRRRVTGRMMLVALPVDLVVGLAAGYDLVRNGVDPAALSWWSFGLLIVVVLLLGAFGMFNWVFALTLRSGAPTALEWDSESVMAYLPALAGGPSALPREVKIPWSQVLEVRPPSFLRPGLLRYSRTSATSPPAAGSPGEFLALSEAASTVLASEFRARFPSSSLPRASSGS